MTSISNIKLPTWHYLPNCSYRYDSNDRVIQAVSLYLDGPLTLLAAIFSLIGTNFAFKFLGKAGLNGTLTAALYLLCLCDASLMIIIILYHSIEAIGILLTNRNVMWDEQQIVLNTHGIVSWATTSSTLLVVFITFQRFLVVWFPLRYTRMIEKQKKRSELQNVRSTTSSQMDNENATQNYLKRHLQLKKFRKTSPSIKKILRPYLFPTSVICFSFLINSTSFFEFELAECYAFAQQTFSYHLFPSTLRQSQTYNMIRTTIMMITQTIGPISTISLLTVITEYKVQVSLKARRTLFESQRRRQSILLVEELREKLSRTVAIFIAVKFIILRSLPIFFDIYETFYGIESFGIILSILVRISDFNVVLNSATNSLAYFGKTKWFEMRLRGRLKKRTILTMNNNNNNIRQQYALQTQNDIVLLTETGSSRKFSQNGRTTKFSIESPIISKMVKITVEHV